MEAIIEKLKEQIKSFGLAPKNEESIAGKTFIYL